MTLPKWIKCKMCGDKFPNPLRQGAKIATSTCQSCRHSMFSQKTLRKIEREKKKTGNVGIGTTSPATKLRPTTVKEKSAPRANNNITLSHYTKTRDK